jgi:GWxTD domain-containing protein
MKQMLLIIFSSFFAGFVCYAQENTKEDVSVKKESSKRTDSAINYKNWIEEEIVYIITTKEKTTFNALKTDEERQSFIEKFWHRRDPNPDTEENEFRDEYTERIAYANEHFISGIEGWKTDRGKIYITYGKPDKIEKGRKDFENLKNISFEIWFYDYLYPFCSKSQFTFTDLLQSNSFRLSDEDREKLSKLPANGLVECYGNH